MLKAFHKSHNTLRAELTSPTGAAITGATVTADIKDKAGGAVATGVSLAEQGDGIYDFIMSNTLLPTENEIYRAEVTAVSGASTRYAEVGIKNIVDTD